MKYMLFSLLFILPLSIFSQSLSACGQDDSAHLNQDESAYLQEYLQDDLKAYELKGKKVLFITGSAASRRGSKSEYFNHIRSWNEKNSRVATTISLLDEEEKEASGGYDLILGYWVKLFTDGRKRKIIRRLSKNKAF